MTGANAPDNGARDPNMVRIGNVGRSLDVGFARAEEASGKLRQAASITAVITE